MISQKCPKCLSNRVRRGYRPTPLWSKILFRYYLLCDNCNWEFTGFAVPGTVSAKPTKRPKKNYSINKNESSEIIILENPVEELQEEATGELVFLENLARPKTKTIKKGQKK